jgi:antitoxin component YwqK of YwqJK toxin-antitoxin module
VGCHRRWHANGILAEEISYHTPPTKCDTRQWNIDGVLLREGVYDGDVYKHKLWDESGTLLEEREAFWNGSKLEWK